VIDSGIAESPDLQQGGLSGLPLRTSSRVVYRESFLPNSAGSGDLYGHGTHVAGIIAGNGWSATQTRNPRVLHGIAPSASLLDLQVLDENGMGTDSAIIAALGRAIELKDVYNIRVVNLSIGRPVFESYKDDPLCQAVEAAWKAGLTVVVAAGNYGRDGFPGSNGYWTITSPGNDPYVITVGAEKTEGTATKSDDHIASYSSKGPTLFDNVVKPDLVAPGTRVTSLLASPLATLARQNPDSLVPASYFGADSGESVYFRLSGTSMAAPVVSGAAVLLLQQEPQLTPDQVKARLMKTASKTFPIFSSVTEPATGTTYTSQYDVFTVGAGYVDIAAALADVSSSLGSALSPVALHDNKSGGTYLKASESSVWAAPAWAIPSVWGSQLFLAGTSLPTGTAAAWGSSAAWGQSAAWGASLAIGNGEN
jgi:serine protease AprX